MAPPDPPGRPPGGDLQNQSRLSGDVRDNTEATVGPAQDVADAQRSAAQDLGIALEKTIELNKIEKQRVQILGDYISAGKIALSTQQEMLMQAQKILANDKLSADEQTAAMQQLSANYSNIVASTNLGKEALEEFNAVITDGTLSLAEKTAKLEEIRGRYDDAKSGADRASNAMGGLARMFGTTSKASETASGKIGALAADLFTGFSADKLKLMGQNLLGMFSIQNILANVADKAFELATALDSVGSSFGKATGFGRGFETQIMGVYKNTVASNVSMQEASAALEALAAGFSKFEKGSQGVNIRLAETVALLDKVGVQTSASVAIMDSFTRSFGMGEIAAAELTRELIMSGTAAGITASKMASDFQSAFGTLSQYGSQAVNIFKGMAAQAKATGIEVNKLIGIAQKFDTFEGAAEAAASLNAVLGTQISSVDLLNANYEDRIDMLRQGIATTVGSFDSMDKFTQLYVAQAIGASDVAEAQRLINMRTSDYTKYKADMMASAETQKQLADRTAELAPLVDKLKIAFTEFVLAVSPAIEGITALLQLMADNTVVLVGVVTTLVGAFGLYQAAVIATTLAQASSLPVIGAMITGLGSMATAVWAALGPVGLAILAFTTLFGVWTMTSSPPHYLLAGVIAIGITALVVALYAIQGPAQIALLLIAALAFSMALMFYAIADGAETMSDLFNSLTNAEGIMESGLAIYYMAGAVGALGLATMLSLSSVMLLLAAMTGLGAVFVGMGIVAGGEGLSALGDQIDKIGGGLSKFAASLSIIKSVVAEISAMGTQGFMAVSVEGGKTSMFLASEGVVRNIDTSNINVKVDIPEIKTPTPVVHVYLDSKEIAKEVKVHFAELGR